MKKLLLGLTAISFLLGGCAGTYLHKIMFEAPVDSTVEMATQAAEVCAEHNGVTRVFKSPNGHHVVCMDGTAHDMP